MNLSENTVSVLKNYSTINQNLLIKPGKVLTTMSAMQNIVSRAEVEEDFPREMAIYDLNEFLSCLSLFANPKLNFKENFVIMTETGSKGKSLKYWFSAPSVVTTTSKEVTMPSSELTFTLSNHILSNVTKAAAVIGAPDMVLTNSPAGNADLKVTDKKNDTANDYSIGDNIDSSDEDANYKFWFKVENLKLLPGAYKVEVSSKKISHFKNTSVDIEYFIALEPESSYG